MTAPEVQWTIEQLGSVISDIDAPLRRVDRDESVLYDGDGTAPDLTTSIRDREGDLQTANYVGVQFVDRATTAIGTEYDHSVEVAVGVRLEGLHHSEYGHVDPDGNEGIAWAELVRRCRRALLKERTWPDAGDVHTSYTDLTFANEVDNSDEFQDFFWAEWDVVFSGYEDLP